MSYLLTDEARHFILIKLNYCLFGFHTYICCVKELRILTTNFKINLASQL